MSQAIPIPPPGFDDLSVDEKIEYVQSLWERIAAGPDEVPLPNWHVRVVAERVSSYLKDPGDGRPWNQVREDLMQKLQDRSSKK